MKNAALIFLSFISITYIKAQTAPVASAFHAYETSFDDKHRKVLRGLLSRADIQSDTSFGWFQKNYKLGRPDAAAVKAFQEKGNRFQMLIFAGTWCPDTHNLLPEFYQLADAANYADSNITLIGLDHSKTTLDNLHKTFNVTEVPTFIVMKEGKEVGRIVEYGESGEAMKELGKLVEGL
jgi:thiol-disulfide isomerase/thioredoxin